MGDKKKEKKKTHGGRGRDVNLASKLHSKTPTGEVYQKSRSMREFSAGGAVFKKVGSSIFWLVCKSRISADYPYDVWRLPKGWIDDSEEVGIPGPISRGEIKANDLQLQETAIREVKEEGGVSSSILKKIGTEKFFFNSKSRNGKVLKFVTFYLMEWTADLPQGFGDETEQIRWLQFEEARKLLTHTGEKEILDGARKLLDTAAA